MLWTKHRRSSFRAFTLVELLVVVAIMVVLMAMLFPAFRSVRCQAQGIVCMSNLRSIAFDFNVVADDPPSLRKLSYVQSNENIFGLTSFLDRVYATGAYSPVDAAGNPVDPGANPRGASSRNRLFQCPAAYQDLTINPRERVLDGAVQPESKTNLAFFARLFEVWRETPSGTWEKHYVSLGRHIFNSWRRASQIPLVLDADIEQLGADAGGSPHLTAPAIERQGSYAASQAHVFGERYFPAARHCGKFNVALIDTSVHSFDGDSNPQMHTLINWSDAQYNGHWDQGIYQGTDDMLGEYISQGSLSESVVY